MPGSIQSGKAEAFSIQSIGEASFVHELCPGARGHSNVVIPATAVGLDESFNQLRISHRTIRSYAKYRIGLKMLCRSIIAVQDICFTARKQRDLVVGTESTQDFIGRIIGNGDYHL